MTTIKAHFDGKSFVPDEPVDLPANYVVTVHVPDADPQAPRTSEIAQRLKALEDLTQMAAETNAPNADWSRERIYSGTLDDSR